MKKWENPKLVNATMSITKKCEPECIALYNGTYLCLTCGKTINEDEVIAHLNTPHEGDICFRPLGS